MKSTKECDVLIIGAGIMGATLAALLKQIKPHLSIKIIEKLDSCAQESSMALNNAGTGHSGFCELNYSIEKAIETCEAFEQSKQFWSYLSLTKHIEPNFINSLPHISFVEGKENVTELKQRWSEMTKICLFQDMEFSDDFFIISLWAPLLMKGRDPHIPVAATRMKRGTDINFGRLTSNLIDHLSNMRVDINYNEEVKDLHKSKEDNWWHVTTNNTLIKSPFVFIGAGGAALTLLEKSGIPEAKGYGGFPVSGQWLICDNPEIVEKHNAKVYGKPEIGSPPMSVPHLDARIIDGKKVLLFGPFAGFSTKFLKSGHWSDFFKSLKFSNVFTIISAGLRNIGLSKYLISEVTKTKNGRFKTLLKYYPNANINDWKPLVAGQRVQVIKRDKGIPTIEFGTEVVTSKDKSIAALMGASPGASVSVKIMLEVIEKCFHDKNWHYCQDRIKSMIPSYQDSLSEDEDLFERVEEFTSHGLKLKNTLNL